MPERFSAALCRGLIEASRLRSSPREGYRFSAALCRGLIEARRSVPRCSWRSPRFPRLYAAASLKQKDIADREIGDVVFSAALCRGLIEARRHGVSASASIRFPRLYAAASLKLIGGERKP